jgi:single-strand DNA-binding protein
MAVNKAIILGFVGNEPEIRQTQDGRAVANFSVATSESWKDKNSGEKKEKTEWHRITAFGNLADIVKNYVRKGSKVYVEGSIQTRKWTDKEGIEKFTTEIILQGFNSTIQLLDSKKDGEVSQHAIDKGNGYAPETNHVEEEISDEIPF